VSGTCRTGDARPAGPNKRNQLPARKCCSHREQQSRKPPDAVCSRSTGRHTSELTGNMVRIMGLHSYPRKKHYYNTIVMYCTIIIKTKKKTFKTCATWTINKCNYILTFLKHFIWRNPTMMLSRHIPWVLLFG
jgi:hypothetical protein